MKRFSLNMVFVVLLCFVLGRGALANQSECKLGFSEHIVDSIIRLYSEYVEFDEEYLAPSAMALKGYPELRGVKIVFKRKSLSTSMAVRPSFWSIFRKKENRVYYILVNTKFICEKARIPGELSTRALTGLISHEYAHITDYEKLNTLGLLVYGIKYLLFKKKIERRTDQIAIEHGYSEELIEFNKYVKKSKYVTQEYKMNKRRNYLSIAEIRDLMASE